MPSSHSEGIPTQATRFFPNNFMYWTVFGPWANNEPLTGVVRGCPCVCNAKIRAPALASTCTTYSHIADYRMKYDFAAVTNSKQAPPFEATGSLISINMLDGPSEAINLVSGYSRVQNCTGRMFVTACTLRSAIGEYEVLVHNDSVSFPSTAEPVIVAVANNTPNNAYLRKEGTVVPSTLVGISDFALGLFTSRVAFESPHGHFTSQSLGVDAHKHAVPSDNDECPSFNDPRIDVIKSLNGLMIYIGAFAAKHNASYAKSHIDPGLELNTTTLGYLQGSHSVYQSSYGFFALAAALVAFTLGLIGSTYWGWWRLGRPVSFSPLEVAKAFQSPLLGEYHFNLTGRELSRYVQDCDIRYGVLKSDSTATRLALGHPDVIGEPGNKQTYDR